MRQNLEKNIEKIVALTLSFGLVTMNVGSSPKKITKSVSDSSLPLMNMSPANIGTDTSVICDDNSRDVVYSSLKNTDPVQAPENASHSNFDRENKKNVNESIDGVIRAPEISLDNQSKLNFDYGIVDIDSTNSIDNNVIDERVGCDVNTDDYELDPSEENMEGLEGSLDLDIDEIVQTKDETSTENNETEKIDCDEVDKDESFHHELKSEEKKPENVKENIKTDENENSSDIRELSQNIEVDPAAELVNEIDINNVVEQEPELQKNEDVLVDNPPQIITTPFGTRIVVEESNDDFDKVDICNEQDTKKIHSVDNDTINNTIEVQNKQVVNPQNNTYPSTVYKTLDDIPEEGLNGVPKSVIAAMAAVGIAIPIILLAIGYSK